MKHQVNTRLETPIGEIELVATAEGLAEINLHPPALSEVAQEITTEDPHEETTQAAWYLSLARTELIEYFAGKLTTFSIQLAPQGGTAFQRLVWKGLQTIPYGQTVSYKQLAALVGKPQAVRAAGSANGKNPIPIIIPCHRVIAADGGLGGYSGGLEIKKILLDLENSTTL